MKKLSPIFIVLTLFSCSSERKEDTGKATAKLVFDPAANQTHRMVYEFQVDNSITGDSPHFKMEVTTTVEAKTGGHVTLMTHYDKISMSGKIHGKAVQLNAADLVGKKDTTDAAVVASPVFVYLGKSFETVYDRQHNKLDEHQVRSVEDSSVVAAESKIQFLGRYPDKELKMGDGWDSGERVKIGSNEITKMHYSVSAITDSEVQLEVKGEINSAGEKFGQEYKVTGQLTGKISIDRKNGWQKETVLDIDFTLNMAEKRIPMKQHITFITK